MTPEEWLLPSAYWRSKALGLDESHHPAVAKMSEALERFTKACMTDGKTRTKGIVLYGGTGVGKTHAAGRVADYVGRFQIHFWNLGLLKAYHLGLPARMRWPVAAAMDDQQWREAMQTVAGARLAVLDDVGAESDRFRNGQASTRLWQVLEATAEKWVMVTTNVPSSDWRERWGVRVEDRLASFGRCDLSGVESWRKRK